VCAAVSSERSTEHTSGPGTAVSHPLDPLTGDEFRSAASVLRRDKGVTDRWRIASIELEEPTKEAVRAFVPGQAVERHALVVCWNRDDGRVYKATVSLTDDRLVSWQEVPDEQPNMTLDEFHEAD
jgi:primary-amine oxidase